MSYLEWLQDKAQEVSEANIGGAVGSALPFDPTPGFNLARRRTADDPMLYRAKTGTRAPLDVSSGNKPPPDESDQPTPTPTPTDDDVVTDDYSAPAKTLDTAQLTSLDALLKKLDADRRNAMAQATGRRDARRNEKEEEKEREEGKYEGKKLGALQDFAGAKTDTDLNTRNTLENLISSLSTLGLGGSRALTRQILDAANMSNRKANATQATNNRDLDSSWNDYTAGNENDMRKINDQFGFDSGEADRKYYQDKQNTLYKKAGVYGDVDDTAQRQKLMSQGDSLSSKISGSSFLNPSYTGKTREMAAPELGDYTQDIARYDTTRIAGANQDPLTPVASDGMNSPGNLAVRAVAVNDKDLGIKKKSENDLGYGV